MSAQHKTISFAELAYKLDEIIVSFESIADPQKNKLVESLKIANAGPEQIQELIDYIRVCVKYQKFNIESLQRENEYLNKLLEDKNQ